MSDFFTSLFTAILNWFSGRKKPNQDDAKAIKETRDEAAEMQKPAGTWDDSINGL